MLALISRADEIGYSPTGSSLSGRVLAPCALSRLVSLGDHAEISDVKTPKFAKRRMCVEHAGSIVMVAVIGNESIYVWVDHICVQSCADMQTRFGENEIQRQRKQDTE